MAGTKGPADTVAGVVTAATADTGVAAAAAVVPAPASFITARCAWSVSYTHLDVYKRQDHRL